MQELITNLLVNQLILMVIAYFVLILPIIGMAIIVSKLNKYLAWSISVFFFLTPIYLFMIGLKLFDGSFDLIMNIVEGLSNNFFMQMVVAILILFTSYSLIITLASLMGCCLLYLYGNIMKIKKKISIKDSFTGILSLLFFVLLLFTVINRMVSWFGGY